MRTVKVLFVKEQLVPKGPSSVTKNEDTMPACHKGSLDVGDAFGTVSSKNLRDYHPS